MLVVAAVAIPVAGAQPVTTVAPPPEAATTPAPGRWTALSTGTKAKLNAVSFADPLNGHAVGTAGTILATADGGKTWAPQQACPAGGTCRPSSGDRITVDLTDVAFWGTSRGVVVGAAGTILSTRDGGKTWSPRTACEGSRTCRPGSPAATTADLTSVSVAPPSHAYAVGKAGAMLASDDHGRTWRRLATCGLDTAVGATCAGTPPKQPADMMSVTATSARVVHAVGLGGAFFASQNGGRSFRRIGICFEACSGPAVPVGEQLSDLQKGIKRAFEPPLVTTDLAAVFMPDRRDPRSAIFAVGKDGLIALAASDTDPSWEVRPACNAPEACADPPAERVGEDLHDLTFPNDLSGYAVGAGGTILSLDRPPSLPSGAASSIAAGQWRRQPSGTTADLHGVSFPTPDLGYAVGDSGTVLKLTRPNPRLQVQRVVPARALTTGRTPVRITGRGFTGATGVYFGPAAAPGFTVDSDTAITVAAPPSPAAEVQVTVVAQDGASAATAAARFTYLPPKGGDWQSRPGCEPGCQGPAVALPGGTVLVAGGVRRDALAGTAATSVYDPKARSWAAAAPLSQPRTLHTVTALADGRAFVVGGMAGTLPSGQVPDFSVRSTAEVYDPRTRAWQPAGEITSARLYHTATLLRDGRVLVAGGQGQSSAEIWEPGSKALVPTGSMSEIRLRHTASLLPDGRVLVVGGCTSAPCGALASAEIFEPASGRWQETAAMNRPHGAHTATTMADGEVLVAGGIGKGGQVVAFSERYDPATGTWTTAAPMRVPRALHSATALADGRILVAGGVSDAPALGAGVDPLLGAPVPSAEIYDPATDRWSLVADMPTPRVMHTALPLATGCGSDCGHVLLAGGAEPFDPPLLYQPAKKEGSGSGIGGAAALLATGGIVLALGFGLAARARRR